MADSSLPPVLRCPLCHKPFDKPSALKRHVYYCRSRRGETIPPARSCIACAAAKTRCDQTRPVCSRCVLRNADCHFPTSKSSPRTARTPAAGGPAASIVSPDDHRGSHDAATLFEGDSPIPTVTGGPTPNFIDSLPSADLTWDVSPVSLASFVDPHVANDILNPSISNTLVRPYSILDQIHPPSFVQTPFAYYQPIPPVPSPNARSLARRHKADAGRRTTSSLLLHTLKSYPWGMIRHGSLPPYISPQLLVCHAKNHDLDPLHNCINLMHMISRGADGSRRLFWRNVQQECAQWQAEVSMMNKWQMLAVLQALSLYVLVRLSEGETELNNLDQLLLATVIIVSKQYGLVAMAELSQPKPTDLCQAWIEWLFEESRRRVCILYQILNTLVYFEPAALCEMEEGLFIAPLPANRQLWEARDAMSWKAFDVDKAGEYGMTTTGALVRLDEQRNGRFCRIESISMDSPIEDVQPKAIADWEEWCSGMDALGSLVMLAASLIAV